MKMSNVNPLMNLKEDGTSHYNDLGLELDRKVGDALRAILEEAIEDHGAIDIRMFAYIANSAVSDVILEKLF